MKLKSEKWGTNALLSKQVVVMNESVDEIIKNDSILLTDKGLRKAKQLNKKLQLVIFLTEEAKLERELERKKITPNEKRKKVAKIKKNIKSPRASLISFCTEMNRKNRVIT